MSVSSLSKNEEQEKFPGSTSYISFINGLRSPATKKGYRNSLKRYMNHLKVTNTVLDSDGNLISTDIDPEDIEFEPKNNLEMNDLKKNAEDLKLRNLVFSSKLIYS